MPRTSRLFSGGLFLAQSFERLRMELAALLHQDLDLAFGGFELLTTGVGQADSFFKQFQRLFQWKVSAFELLDDFLQLLQAFFKFRQ